MLKISPPEPFEDELSADEIAHCEYFQSRIVVIRPGDKVFVLKSRSSKAGTCRVFARGIIEKEETDRVRVVYGDGSTYAVRPCNLIPIVLGGILICRTTAEYRLAAATQPANGELALEIGCDCGETCKRLFKATKNRVIGIDKAAVRIDTARKYLDEDQAIFFVLDVFHQPILLPARPDVVFLDINGSRELRTVCRLLRWIQIEWRPRLLVVKSVQFVQKALSFTYSNKRTVPPSALIKSVH